MGKKDYQTIDWVSELSDDIDQIKLRQLFDYNPETGEFIKKETGKPVGCLDKSTGYIRYRYAGKNHRVHRLIWIWLHGSIPDGYIVDHGDNDRTNNRVCNLRLKTTKQNTENIKRANKNNHIGIRGVSKKGSYYISRITHKNKTILLGVFPTAELAGMEYLRQKDLLHTGHKNV